MSRIDDIRARYNDNGLTDDQYRKIKSSDIAQMRVDIKRVLHELDRVTRERDAAVEDMRELREKTKWLCHACKYDGGVNDTDICLACSANHHKNWKWRGPQEGE